MNKGHTDNFERDCDAALGWIARFRSGSASEQDRRDFALWLAADPNHGRAMDRMQDMWDDLGSVQHLPEMELPRANSRRQWLGASLAVAASLVLALLLLPQFDQPIATQQFQTAVGERRTVTLPDQSQVTMNTNSRLSIRFSDTIRHVTLQQGEAYFQVSSNPKRPFEVDSGTALVTVVGTAFNIFRDDNHSEVTVAEGIVRVTELNAPATRAANTEILRANEYLQADHSGFSAGELPDVSARMAWQRGELQAREMSLSALVAELERYHELHILIADPDVASRTVSGVFQLDHPETILQALQRSADVKVTRLDEHTVQLLPAAQ